MLWFVLGGVTALYLLLWPFSVRVDARLSPTCGRAEVVAASLLRLRLEGDFLQPPWLSVHRLDRLGRRRPLGQKRRQRQRKRAGFAPVLRDCRLSATLYVGVAADGALTVEALGLLHTLLEAAGRGFGTDVVLRPVSCFDKTICALRLSGIGRFVLAQNILEYLKGKLNHAKR